MSNTIINGGASPYPKHVGPSAIASFSDGAQDAPLKSLKFYISPNQDLHGYSYPWPGGGGKNLCPPLASATTSNGVTFTPQSDGSIKCTGTASAFSYCALPSFSLSAGTYTLTGASGWGTGANPIKRLIVLKGGGAIANDYGSGSTFTITEASTVNVRIDFGSGATTGVTAWPMVRKSTEADSTFAPYSNICPISGWSQVDGKQSGEDMSDYTPITIALGQTVYGGNVDALNGKMVIDSELKTLTGNNNWQESAGVYGYVLYNVLATAQSRAPYISNLFKTLLASDPYNQTGIFFGQNNKHIYVTSANNISGVTDLASFKAYLNSNNLQIVIPLATPIEVDLTPVSVNSLLGQNNIWCNTGDTELDYYPAAASVVAVLNRSSKVYTSIPLGKIRYDTYQTTPNQTLDLDSYRAETGVLIRNVLSHTATKIEFNTPSMTNLQWEEVWNIIKAGFNNSTERKLKLKYYDQMSATYKTGWFYVPDVQFTIRNIDEAAGIINYDEVRVAFIEY